MPTLEDYLHLRQIGSAQQEFANLQAMQGAKIEKLGNELVQRETNEDQLVDEESEEGMPDAMKQAIIIKLRKKKESQRDFLGREQGHMENSMRPYLP